MKQTHVRIWLVHIREYASVDVTVTVEHKRAQLAADAGMTFAVGALKTVKSLFSNTNNTHIEYYNINK